MSPSPHTIPRDGEPTLYSPYLRTRAGRHRVLTVVFWNLVSGCGPALAAVLQGDWVGWVAAYLWATLWWFFIAREQSAAAASELSESGREWRGLTPSDYGKMLGGAVALQLGVGVFLGVLVAIFTALTDGAFALAPFALGPVFLVVTAMLVAYWGRVLVLFGLGDPSPLVYSLAYGVGSTLIPVSRELAHVLVASSVWGVLYGLVTVDSDAWPLAAVGSLFVLSLFQVSLGRLGALALLEDQEKQEARNRDDLELPAPQSSWPSRPTTLG